MCAFCGKNEVTKEHLFAKWIRDEYADHRASGLAAMELRRNDETEWSYDGDALEHTVRNFCAGCNNGWMSRLETKTAKIVQPMLRGRIKGPITMRLTDQATVASWATKTALLLQQLHPSDNRIPQSYYRNFHRTQQPSSDVFVIMGARRVAGDGNVSNLFEHMQRFIGTESSGIQHIHFAVGFAYFGITIFIQRPRRFPKLMPAAGAGLCNLIWPCSTTASWPTLPIDEVGGVKGMFAAFSEAHWP